MYKSIRKHLIFLKGASTNFELAKGEYCFMSGASGWGTVLKLKGDGTFTGAFHDSESGDFSQYQSAEDPNDPYYQTGQNNCEALLFLCDFSGRFDNVRQVGRYEYTADVKGLKLKRNVGESEIVEENGAKVYKYYTNPYGITEAKTVHFYLQNMPVADLPQSLSV